MRRIVIMGPPGAGKGTQGTLLAEALEVPRYSTGDILREACRQGTKLGLEAQSFMDAGELVPDDVMLGIIDEALDAPAASAGYILDGFPRTVIQAEGLEAILKRQGRPLDAVLYLDVPEEELVRRLSGRATMDGRTDDVPDTVRRRLQVYRNETAPLVDWYRGRPIPVVEAEGVGAVDDVQRSIRGLLDS